MPQASRCSNLPVICGVSHAQFASSPKEVSQMWTQYAPSLEREYDGFVRSPRDSVLGWLGSARLRRRSGGVHRWRECNNVNSSLVLALGETIRERGMFVVWRGSRVGIPRQKAARVGREIGTDLLMRMGLAKYVCSNSLRQQVMKDGW